MFFKSILMDPKQYKNNRRIHNSQLGRKIHSNSDINLGATSILIIEATAMKKRIKLTV